MVNWKFSGFLNIFHIWGFFNYTVIIYYCPKKIFSWYIFVTWLMLCQCIYYKILFLWVHNIIIKKSLCTEIWHRKFQVKDYLWCQTLFHYHHQNKAIKILITRVYKLNRWESIKIWGVNRKYTQSCSIIFTRLFDRYDFIASNKYNWGFYKVFDRCYE